MADKSQDVHHSGTQPEADLTARDRAGEPDEGGQPIDDTHILRFEFADDVKAEELEVLVVMAVAAVQGIYGATAVRLEAPLSTYVHQRVLEIDDSLETGRALSRALYFMAGRTLGVGSLRVQRIPRGQRPDGLPSWVEEL